MGKFKVRMLVLLGALLMVAGSAFADVPSNLTVSAGGYQWVWASPCAPVQPSCGQALNLTDGWSIPTVSEWQASFSSTADVYNTFTLNGTGQLCGSAYFNSGYSHCDSSDVQAGYIWGAPLGISNNLGGATNLASETFLVRGGAPAVPEPSSMLLLGSGALGLINSIRRKFRR